MGLSGAELRRVMREDGLIVAMEQLREATNMYGEDMMGQVIPNIRALRGILDLMGSNAEENKKIFDSLTNSTGALDKAFEAASQTTEFKWNQSLTRVKTSFVTLGAQLQGVIVPMLEKLSKTVERVAEWFDGLSDGGQKTVLIMAGMTAAAGPLLIVTGNMIRAFMTLRTAILAVNLAAAPYLAIAVGLGIVIRDTVRALTKKKAVTEEIKGVDDKYNETLKDQTAELSVLFDRLEKTNQGSEDRKRLIKEINSQYGTTLQNYKDEKKFIDQIVTAKDELIKRLTVEIKLQANKQRLIDLYKEEEQAVIGVGTAYASYGAGAAMDGIAGQKSQALIDQAQSRLDGIRAYRDELMREVADGEDFLSLMGKKTITTETQIPGGDPENIEEARTAYERLTDQIDILKSSLQDMAQQRAEGGDVSIVDEQSIREQLIGLERLKEAIDEAMQFPDQALTDTKSKLAQMRAELEKHGKSEQEIREMALQQELVQLDNEKQLKLTKLKQGSQEYLQTEKQYLELADALRQAYADKEKQLAEDVTAKKKEELEKQVNQIGYALMSERERLVEQYKAIALQIEEAFDAGAIDTMAEKLRLLQGVLQETGKELMKIDKPDLFGVDAFENIERWYQANKDALSQLYEDQDAFYKAMAELNKEYTQMQIDAIKLVAEGVLDTFSKLFGVLKGFYKEGSDEYKMFARAQIIMDTARAAMAAYAAMAGIPAVGPGLGVAAAAAAVAAGALQLAQLETATYPGAATGGRVTSGGGVIVGEDGAEMVNLRPGSVVNSNPEVRVKAAITQMTSAIKDVFNDVGTLNTGLAQQVNSKSYTMSGIRGGDYSMGEERLITRIRGRDLEVVLERSQAQSKRR
jgi:hypothetical protein